MFFLYSKKFDDIPIRKGVGAKSNYQRNMKEMIIKNF